MAESVSIKGTKSGIILVLDNTIPFDELKNIIFDKFSEAASFLGNAKMGLVIRGRNLSESEEREVLDIISRTTRLNIVCIVDEENPLDSVFTKMVNEAKTSPKKTVMPQAVRPQTLTEEEKRILQNEAYDEAYRAAFESIGDANARIHVGNIRSGQEIISTHSLVIFGDVNPGGSLVSAGSIFVFGSLLGTAFAGATGNGNAFVMATDFRPLQVRISDAIAVSADKEVQSRTGIIGRRKTKKEETKGPEVAYTYQGAIARSAYDKKFLRSNKFFS